MLPAEGKKRRPKVPLTPEEIKLRKAEKKAERIKKAEELRIQLRKEDLDIELNLENINKKLAKVAFDALALKKNLPLVKSESKNARAWFSKAIDTRDNFIKFLLEKFEDAKTQKELARQSQLEITDAILNVYHTELRELQLSFESDKDTLINRACRFIARANCQFRKARKIVHTVIYYKKKKHRILMKRIKGNNLRTEDELMKKNRMQMIELCSKYEMKLAQLWKNYKDIFANYRDSTTEMRKHYRELKIKDAEDDRTIRSLAKKLGELQELVTKDKKLRSEESNRSPRTEKIKDLEVEKKRYAEVYDQLRTALKTEALIDEKQIHYLTIHSNEALKRLEKLKEKAEQSLKLMSLCKKYETEEEKIVPLPDVNTDQELSLKMSSQFDDLEKLWLRHTNISIQNRYMGQVVERLERDQCLLKEKLKQALVEIGETPSLPNN